VVANPRAASGARRAGLTPVGQGPSPDRVKAGALTHGKLKPLNQPRPVSVETDGHGAPIAIDRRAVEAVIETWHVEDEWWRPQPVSRAYWRLLLEDGRTVDVYRDVLRGRWYRQAYTG
jgi:hypothetical protein